MPYSYRNSHLMLSRNIFDRMLSLARAYNSDNNLINLNSSSLISTIKRCFYSALAASQKEPKRIGMLALRAKATMLSRVSDMCFSETSRTSPEFYFTEEITKFVVKLRIATKRLLVYASHYSGRTEEKFNHALSKIP
jgi:hypothetical protein